MAGRGPENPASNRGGPASLGRSLSLSLLCILDEFWDGSLRGPGGTREKPTPDRLATGWGGTVAHGVRLTTWRRALFGRWLGWLP